MLMYIGTSEIHTLKNDYQDWDFNGLRNVL